MELGREAAGAHREVDGRPVAVDGPHQVGVARVLHGVRGAAVREHRIGRARLERPPRAVAAGDRDGVAPFGAALGQHQVPALADAVQVRGLGGGEPDALPHRVRLALELPGRGVEAALEDPLALPVPHRALPRQVALAVGVPAQVRVDADGLADEHRLAPRAGRVLGGDDGLAGPGVADVRGHEPEPAVVEAQRRAVDPARGPPVAAAELLAPVQDVPDLRPGDQVAAVVDRRAGEVLEARVREVVVLADAADRGVGVEAGDDRPLGRGDARTLHSGTVLRGGRNAVGVGRTANQD